MMADEETLGAIWVIGASSSGMGRAVAIHMVTGRRTAELEALRIEIERIGGTAHAIQLDLTDGPSTMATVGRIEHTTGDVETPFLRHQPILPSPQARETMLKPTDVARGVEFVTTSPSSVCINELVITPTRNLSYGGAGR